MTALEPAHPQLGANPARRGDSKVLQSGAKRHPPSAGIGRTKGNPNKVTRQLKEMILGALDQAGGQDYLARQATTSPTAFLALIGRVLPTTIAGDAENPVKVVHRINLVPIEPRKITDQIGGG